MWTIDEALTEIRAIQPAVKQFNFHVALGGGVLNAGRSVKDLDLYFLPIFDRGARNLEALFVYLDRRFGPPAAPRNGMSAYGGERRYRAMKEYRVDGRRIDVFVF